MLFTSPEYLFAFVPIVFAAYWLVIARTNVSIRAAFLTIASFVFFGWYAPKMVAFPIVMMGINWSLSRFLRTQKGGRRLLIAAVTVNLLPLVFYKYTTFLFPPLAGILKLAVPLGISYFTFVQIAFVVDTYRGKTVDSVWDYALASIFWPKIVAGPIVRPAAFAAQWRRPINVRFPRQRFYLALVVFLLGLFKKMVLADPLGQIADWGWSVAGTDLTTGAAWLTTFAYTLQLYFDFSGYSDMAWGVALLFNIKLPWNFHSPYKASSIQDFWRRWHISLSFWLRDYLYFTFGGSRCGLAKTLRNVVLTFTIGGIWHGAGWTFVCWGLFHGLMLSVNNLWRKLQSKHLPMLLGWALTILGVHLAWVFFRAPDIGSAFAMLRAMFTTLGTTGYDWTQSSPILTYGFVIFATILLFFPNTRQLVSYLNRRRHNIMPSVLAGALCGTALVAILVCGLSESMPTAPFVYFQF